MTGKNKIYSLLAILFIIMLACNAPATAVQPTEETVLQPSLTDTAEIATEASTVVEHQLIPSSSVPSGNIMVDVESSGTGPDKRAPYGDSYDINLLERPFLQDMTYVPDLDINNFSIGSDETWHYVSIKLIGTDPNNSLGINYAVEIDTDRDGFGDFIIWAKPAYTSEWTTQNVQVFTDKNHDSSAVSASQSDAPTLTDGYETQIFDGANGFGEDPDLAWVRMANQENATIQFAFKRSLAGDMFMIGVLADAGLKDAGKLDYIDRFTEAEAGSSVRDKQYYPLGMLYSVDNTCREAFGFSPTGDETGLCPVQQSEGPHDNNNNNPTQPTGCQPPGGSCQAGYYWWPDPHCACSTTPYNP
jgi:hypothetical protein